MSLNKIQLYTTIAVIFFALIIIILERIFPYTKGQKFLREGFFNDFFLYTIFQSYILGLVIAAIISFIDNHTGLSRLQLVSNWPFLAQLTFFLVEHDLYIYWFHRWQHNNKFLWRIHEAHHSVRDVDWLAGSRSHALEILINQTIEFTPIVLLGASPEIAIIKGAIDAIWGMYIHSNIDVRSGKLQYIINGPEMHRWHHADMDNEAYNRNFSTKLAIWDWIFKTQYKPEDKKPKVYGLSYLKFPKNFFIQQLFAFRKFEND